MNAYVDRQYLLRVSHRLERFKEKGRNVWNFRCYACGDSKRNKFKARGFVYEHDNSYFFKCWNCDLALPFGAFLKQLDPNLYHEYIVEQFKPITFERPREMVEHITPNFDGKIMLPSIQSLASDDEGKAYVLQRMIPEQYHSILYYTSDFKSFCDEMLPNHGRQLYMNEKRLIIPFFDFNGSLIGFQGRTIENSKIKYITMKMHEDAKKFYGLERVDITKTIRVCEGPIDSMLLQNGVATCDSSLSIASKYLPKDQLVLVYDMEYHNTQIRKSIEKAITEGYHVCIFPKNFPYKDINESVMGGMSLDEINQIIEERTFTGLRAQLELKG